jgi:hypothetical protein
MWIVVAALVLMFVGVPAAYVVGVQTGAVKDYQRQRVEVITNPEAADSRGYGYHTKQSIITVGKGGMTGAHSSSEFSQAQLKYLPEPHTDFIYAVTAENTGFVGSALLLLAYAVLLSKLVLDARQAQTAPECSYHGIRRRLSLLDLRQRRNGLRTIARHRRPAPADERRTLRRALDLHRHRLRRQRATAKVRELGSKVRRSKVESPNHMFLTL